MTGTGLLAGKRILVTGVATPDSIAAATVVAACAQGATVVASAFPRDLEGARRTLSALAPEVPLLSLDATSEADLDAAAGADPRRPGRPRRGPARHRLRAPSRPRGGAGRARRGGGAGLPHQRAQLRRPRRPPGRPGPALAVPAWSASTSTPVGAWSTYNWMGICKSALESANRYLARDLGSRRIRSNLVAAGPLETRAAVGHPRLGPAPAGLGGSTSGLGPLRSRPHRRRGVLPALGPGPSGQRRDPPRRRRPPRPRRRVRRGRRRDPAARPTSVGPSPDGRALPGTRAPRGRSRWLTGHRTAAGRPAIGTCDDGERTRLLHHAALGLGIDVVVLSPRADGPAVRAGARWIEGHAHRLDDLRRLARALRRGVPWRCHRPGRAPRGARRDGPRGAPRTGDLRRGAQRGSDPTPARGRRLPHGGMPSPEATPHDHATGPWVRLADPGPVAPSPDPPDGTGFGGTTGRRDVHRTAGSRRRRTSRLDVSHELVVVVVRRTTGWLSTYPVIEVARPPGRRELTLPAAIPREVADGAGAIAAALADGIDAAGAFAVGLWSPRTGVSSSIGSTSAPPRSATPPWPR